MTAMQLVLAALATSVACNVVLWRNLFAWRRVALQAEKQVDRYFIMWASLKTGKPFSHEDGEA